MELCPPPGCSDLSEKQSSILEELFRIMQEENFNHSNLIKRQNEILNALQAAIKDREGYFPFYEELIRVNRWWKLPGYWLSYFFQLLESQTQSSFGFLACLLYAEAQIIANSDSAIDSLEKGYYHFTQVKSKLNLSKEVGEKVEYEFRLNLELFYKFYQTRLRNFSYGECDPINDHVYSKKTWMILSTAFPELGHSKLSQLGTKLTSIIERCQEVGLLYYRILARRFLGSWYTSNHEYDKGLEQLRCGLSEVYEFALATETGHFHRLYGYVLRITGQISEAIIQFKKAYNSEPLETFFYWKSLSARELGDAQAEQANLVSENTPAFLNGLAEAQESYRLGRFFFDGHFLNQSVPASKAVEMQIFRSYADNAINVSSRLGSFTHLLGEIECNGPRQVSELLTEIRVAEKTPGISAENLRSARDIFYRHWGTVSGEFKKYFSSIIPEYKQRITYTRIRNTISNDSEYFSLSSEVADEISKMQLPGVGFLLFHVGWRQTSIVFLDMSSGKISRSFIHQDNESYIRLSQIYQTALQSAYALPDPRSRIIKAIDLLLAGVEEFLSPCFEEIVDCCFKKVKRPHLMIFPRLGLNLVPFHALKVQKKLLMERCLVSYGQNLNLFLGQKRIKRNRKTNTILLIIDEQRTSLYSGLVRYLEHSVKTKLLVLSNPSVSDFLKACSTFKPKDMIFACHGEYDQINPMESSLLIRGNKGVSLRQILAEVVLKNCRSITLGACESGLAKTETNWEYMGFPGAFLAAGAQYVVGSLWKVNQLATVILLSRFFEILNDSKYSVPKAFNLTQQQIRLCTNKEICSWINENLTEISKPLVQQVKLMGMTPFDHPYFWGGFYISGEN